MAVALSTLAFVVAIAWWLDRRRQRARIVALEQQLMALDSRQDRLQELIDGKKRTWGDSLDLTKFNWQKPGHF